MIILYTLILAETGSDYWASSTEDHHHRLAEVKLPHGASKRKMSKPVKQRIKQSSLTSNDSTEKIKQELKPALPPIVLTVPSMLSTMPVHSKLFFFLISCINQIQKIYICKKKS